MSVRHLLRRRGVDTPIQVAGVVAVVGSTGLLLMTALFISAALFHVRERLGAIALSRFDLFAFHLNLWCQCALLLVTRRYILRGLGVG